MIRYFTKHPHSVGESYWQHFRFATRFAICCLQAAFYAFAHAVFPFLFDKMASHKIRCLYKDLDQTSR